MERINKIKEYIKNNKLYILVMLIGIIAFAIQTKFVVLYADDLTLGKIAKDSNLIEEIKFLLDNYMNWGGGPTPLIAIIFLNFGIKVWKIFSCLIMFAIVAISVNLVSKHTKINKAILASLVWSFIFILSIWISRETLYWLDGHLAYVLTAFQLLLYFYYLYTKLILNKTIKKYDYIILPILAFFSGWTGPQVAGLTVLMGVMLLLWKKIVKKEKIQTIFIVTLAFSILGCLVEVLAPGNNARMQESFPQFAQYGILEKILYRVESVYTLLFDFKNYGFGSLAFYVFASFGLTAIIAYHITKEEKNNRIKSVIRALSIIVILFCILAFVAKLGLAGETEIFNKLFDFKNIVTEHRDGTFGISKLLPYAISSIIMLSVCIEAFYISMTKKDCILLTTMVAALISHGMMVISPYSSLRSTFITILFLWIAIAYLIGIAKEKEIKIAYPILLAMLIAKIEFRNNRNSGLLWIKKFMGREKRSSYHCSAISIIGIW